MSNSICYVPVSIGELIDKYTILQIKQNKIQNMEKKAIIEKELLYLQPFVDKYYFNKDLIDELRNINEKLWIIEDNIRHKEKLQSFDNEFINFARSVYITNDKRYEIKNKLNELCNSELFEIKSYTSYNTTDFNETQFINVSETVDKLYNKLQTLDSLDYDKLVENYKKILKLNPVNINKYLRELGEIYEKQNKFYEAVECYVKIIKDESSDISTIGILTNQIGICYFNLNQYKLAIHYFKKVLKIKEIPDVYSNIGTCNVNLKNYKEAEIHYLKSYKLQHNNLVCLALGDIYYYIKKYDLSIKYYTKLVNPTSMQLYNMSFGYLAKKNFKIGFDLYEERLKFNNVNPQTKINDRLEVPLDYWDGITICNNLVIISEQGLGDNIQYYRFIIELSKKYPDMIISYFCKQELSHIFQSYNNIKIIQKLQVYNFDYKIYIMSLPKLLNLTQIIPNKINYIKTNEDKLIFWKNKTNNLTRYKVGFVYKGLLNSFIDKYIPIEEYESLSKLNIDLICIHRKNDIEQDLININKYNINHYDIDEDTPLEDTIALLQTLDLLITIDTFIVHIAGILNVKTWLLLGISEWRWSNDISKTYWYNSIELIRTTENEELKDTLKRVEQKLAYELSYKFATK